MSKNDSAKPRSARRKAKDSSLCPATSSYVNGRAKEISREKPKTSSHASGEVRKTIRKDLLSGQSSSRGADVTALRRALNLPLIQCAPSQEPAEAQVEIHQEEEIKIENPSPQSSDPRPEEFSALLTNEVRRILPSGPALPAKGWVGFLNRAFSWLRTGNAAPKQLRVSETVALGEKRFVAIVHAEGHKFLIGGSATGVSLLTRLDDGGNSVNDLAPAPVVAEAAQ